MPSEVLCYVVVEVFILIGQKMLINISNHLHKCSMQGYTWHMTMHANARAAGRWHCLHIFCTSGDFLFFIFLDCMWTCIYCSFYFKVCTSVGCFQSNNIYPYQVRNKEKTLAKIYIYWIHTHKKTQQLLNVTCV